MDREHDLPLSDAIEILKETGLPFWLPYSPPRGMPSRTVHIRVPEVIDTLYEEICRELKGRIDYRNFSEFVIDACIKLLILIWKAKDAPLPEMARALPSLIATSQKAWHERRYSEVREAIANVEKALELYIADDMPQRTAEYLDEHVQLIMRIPDLHLRMRWLKLFRNNRKIAETILKLKKQGLSGLWSDIDKLIEATRKEDKLFRELSKGEGT